jgi:anti-anti-sigma factor
MSETTQNFQTIEKPESAAGHAGAMVVALVGSADVSAGAALDQQLAKLGARRPKRVVFDLSQLKYISSVCISLLLKFRTTMSGWGGKVTLAAPNDMIAGTLRHALLDKVLTIEPSVALALAAGDE